MKIFGEGGWGGGGAQAGPDPMGVTAMIGFQ